MRIDALQAAFLRVKLKMIDSVTEHRRAHARMYHAALCDKVTAPDEHDHEKCVYHTYVVQTDRRDELRDHLLAHGIESKIHYPTLIPFLKSASYLEYRRGDFPVAEKQAREVLSLPVAEYLDPQEINQVIDALEGFFR